MQLRQLSMVMGGGNNNVNSNGHPRSHAVKADEKANTAAIIIPVPVTSIITGGGTTFTSVVVSASGGTVVTSGGSQVIAKTTFTSDGRGVISGTTFTTGGTVKTVGGSTFSSNVVITCDNH